jgi:hypothetical protein
MIRWRASLMIRPIPPLNDAKSSLVIASACQAADDAQIYGFVTSDCIAPGQRDTDAGRIAIGDTDSLLSFTTSGTMHSADARRDAGEGQANRCST